MLGGIAIPHECGLDGHSDADVVCHAVMDALLGAIAAGDIGQHFPNTEARWKDANSLELLKHVGHVLEKNGWSVVNVDVAVVAEAPRLAPHIPAMRERMATALGLTQAAVSVKATTSEGMGALGRGEGIGAMAVASVKQS